MTTVLPHSNQEQNLPGELALGSDPRLKPGETSTGMQPDPSRLRPVDMHVHAVGTGAGGTGCWLRLQGWRRVMARYMLRHIGLPARALAEDFDRLYVERLLSLLRRLFAGRAVILAHDLVRDDQGRVIDGASAFYVPNEYVLGLARQHAEFLAGVSIHPARPDALDELDRCIAGGRC
jgi:hypothetical protein